METFRFTEITTDVCRRQWSLIGIQFKDPSLRPAIEEEIFDDVRSLIARKARENCDPTCPQLNYDDLVQEGWKKYVEIVGKGKLEATRSRLNFFKYFTAAINNFYRSQIQKYRFTQKRTGIKPPKRGHNSQAPSAKSLETHLDDPNNHVQVTNTGYVCSDTELRAYADDFSQYLTPAEALVMREMLEPCQRTLDCAYLAAHRGKSVDDPIRIDFSDQVHAEGLGMAVAAFKEYVLSVRRKYLRFVAMNNSESASSNEVRKNAALAQLAKAFNLQVPSVDEMIIRRMMSIAACKNFDLVEKNPQLQKLLAIVGAKIPKRLEGDRYLSCYGLLYEDTDKRCLSCGLRRACRVEAANFGLETLRRRPEMLERREPVIFSADPEVSSPRDMEIVAFLDDNFMAANIRSQITYSHNDEPGQPIFRLNKTGDGMAIVVVGPSRRLKERLTEHNGAWIIDPSVSADDAVDIIGQHAKETILNG